MRWRWHCTCPNEMTFALHRLQKPSPQIMCFCTTLPNIVFKNTFWVKVRFFFSLYKQKPFHTSFPKGQRGLSVPQHLCTNGCELQLTSAEPDASHGVDPRWGFHRRLRLQAALRWTLHQQLHPHCCCEPWVPPGWESGRISAYGMLQKNDALVIQFHGILILRAEKKTFFSLHILSIEKMSY